MAERHENRDERQRDEHDSRARVQRGARVLRGGGPGGRFGRGRAAGPTSPHWGTVNYDDLGDLPDAAALASIGCGNPTVVADLQPGETVLDLGSGGGIDVLLSAACRPEWSSRTGLT